MTQLGILRPLAVQPTPAAAAAAKQRQLRHAAQEFEGMLMSELWKGMEKDPMASSSDSGGSNASIQSLGLQAMSTALSAAGGLGLAKLIERELTPATAAPLPAAGAGMALKPAGPAADNLIELGAGPEPMVMGRGPGQPKAGGQP